MLDKLPRKKASRVRLLVEQNLRSIATDFKLKSRFASLGLEASVSELLPTPSGASDTEPCQAQEQPIIQSEVTAALAENGTPLLLGSDHSISLAGLRALSRSVDAVGLLWFDATASFMPPTDGGRADPAGTVLSRALGYDPNVRAIKPQLSPENVVLIGLRDVAPHEAEIIKESRVTVFTIADIDALGIREVMLQALRTAMAGTKGFYVTYCPAVTDIPGTISGSGGITLRETHQAMEIIAQTKAMLAMDAVGLGPGQERRIVAETCNFIMSCFGKQIL